MPDLPPPISDIPGSADAGDTAIALLSDPARRAVLGVLGDAHGTPLSADTVSDRAPLDATPRLIRDRIRELERAGVLDPQDAARGATWVLTGAGQDLHRLLALMSRIVVNAAGLRPNASASTRDRVLGRTLEGLADPVVMQILRVLAAGATLSPVELEAGCSPTPRRTVYRRLSPLVDHGVVVRTTTGQVPRTTMYTLNDEWRPAVAIRLLSAWWATRHPDVAGAAVDPDLEGLLTSVSPRARTVTTDRDGVAEWRVRGARSTEVVRIVLSGGRITLAETTADPVPTDVTTAGDAGDWTAAIVSGATDRLTHAGDRTLGEATVAAVRAAALSYVR